MRKSATGVRYCYEELGNYYLSLTSQHTSQHSRGEQNHCHMLVVSVEWSHLITNMITPVISPPSGTSRTTILMPMAGVISAIAFFWGEMVIYRKVMINLLSLSSLLSPLSLAIIVIVTAGWQGEAGMRLVATQAALTLW